MIFTDSKGRQLKVDRWKQLNQMSDHDLLVQLHERMDNHLLDHQAAMIRGRWSVGAVIAVIGAIATAGLLVR